MNNDKYFIISNCSDGISISQTTKQQIIKDITPDKNGETAYGNRKIKFIDYLPDNYDGYLHMDDDCLIIIKGEFVIPKEKQVVTQYEM